MSEEKEVSIIQIDPKTGDVVEIPRGMEYSENALAVGVVVPLKNKTSIDYLKNSRDYRVEPVGSDNIKQIMKLCRVMYLTEGIVGTTVDLFVDYSLTEIEIDNLKSGSKERAILEWWLSNLNKNNDNMERGINGLVSEIMLDYWTYGNCFVYNKTESVPSTEIDSKSMRGKSIKLPLDVYLLDPLFINIPEYITIAGGGKQIFLELEDDFITQLRNDKALQTRVLKGFSKEEVTQILKNKELPLDMERLKHFKRKSRGYDEWGVPYLTKTFNAIMRKKKIQALDEATIDGLINQITIFKIGEPLKDDPMKATWDPRRIAALSALLSHPNPSNWIVWQRDISTETVSPNENILGLDKKYVQVDKEILKSLGIPTVLLSGEGSTTDNTENVWVAISSLLEKIEGARSQVKSYLEDLMYKILKDNGLDTKNRPTIRWRKPNLRNEKEFADFTLALFDRGVLPIEILVKESGHKWVEVLRGRIEEATEKLEGKSYEEVFKRRDLPFGTPTGQDQGGKPGVNQPQGKSPVKKGVKPTKKSDKTTTLKKKEKASFDGEEEIKSFIEDQGEQFIKTYEEDKANIDIKLAVSFHYLNSMVKYLVAQYGADNSAISNLKKTQAKYIKLFNSDKNIEEIRESLPDINSDLLSIFSNLQKVDPEEGVDE